jgi:hypothetical protein
VLVHVNRAQWLFAQVLMGMHDGRVPTELKDIYDELAAE